MKISNSLYKRILPGRIWQQIFIMLAVLVVVPLIILGSLLIRTSQNSIKTTVLRDYKQIAVNATGKVEEKIESARQALHVTASILGTLNSDKWRQETTIVELSLRYPIFKRIASVDLDGFEIVTSELGTSLNKRTYEEGFQKAKSGESYISNVRVAQNHIPFLTMAVPVRQLDRTKGVLMAEVNLRGIWDIVDSIQFGETGKAFLVDQDGRIIAHPDKKLILKGVKSKYEEVVSNVLSGSTGSMEVKVANAEPCLVAYSPINSLRWGIVIDQSVKEAFAFSKIMRMQSWVLILLSVFVAMIVSFFLSKFMSKPVKKLIDRTNRLAQGDFEHSFRIRRRDEIGKLLFSFNQMAKRLQKAQKEEKLSMVGKAATSIAHELKNSLVLVKTFVQLLPKRHKDESFIEEFSKMIPRELDSWNKMLKNMMDFSSLEKITMEYLDINIVLLEILDLAKFRVSQKNIHFDVSIKSNLPLIFGNADKLKQVILNLITNAIDATESGDTIVIDAGLVNDAFAWTPAYIEIKVANFGQGVLIEDLRKIFEPFYTTKSDGLGLGLSISKEIIKQHGGRIEVICEESKEITFAIQLPAKRAFRLEETEKLGLKKKVFRK
ncbi:MAG: sensor histidine kinase [Candidatus Omnitrophica bacterium]|nr:sensor histidine kinase [Candidatus Omnitrophota bacterium]